MAATRWVEDTNVADQLIEIWNIIIIVWCLEKLPKIYEPSSESFFYAPQAVIDQFSVAKFQFFNFVRSLFKPFDKTSN